MAQLTKKDRRLRRATRGRAKIRELGAARLTVHRTPQHIYAQVTTADGARVLAAASSVQEAVAKELKGTGNARPPPRSAARSRNVQGAGVDAVAFDRSGFRYHGRVKALAEAAREAGLKF